MEEEQKARGQMLDRRRRRRRPRGRPKQVLHLSTAKYNFLSISYDLSEGPVVDFPPPSHVACCQFSHLFMCRNFGYAWKSNPDECSSNYPGSKPFSEPETRAIRVRPRFF